MKLEHATRRRVTDRSHPREHVVPVSEIIANQQVRDLCGGITRHTLISWRETQDFPQPIRTLDRVELWDARQVRAWLKQRGR